MDEMGMQSAQQRKQLRYMTNLYRKQIFQINDIMNEGIPKSIQLQAQTAKQQQRIRTEILKRP